MLVGQALPEAKLQLIREFLEDLEGIDRVTDLKTRQLSSHEFQLKAEVIFSGGELARRLMADYVDPVVATTDEEEAAAVLGRFSENLMVVLAEHVDFLEKEIRAEFPGAIHIDLEPHVRDF